VVYSFDEGGYLSMKEGVTITMKRRKGLGAAASPIYIGYAPLLSLHT
jgi:hypothetical protein